MKIEENRMRFIYSPGLHRGPGEACHASTACFSSCRVIECQPLELVSLGARSLVVPLKLSVFLLFFSGMIIVSAGQAVRSSLGSPCLFFVVLLVEVSVPRCTYRRGFGSIEPILLPLLFRKVLQMRFI